jgi:hypothetical protein
VGIFLPVS